MSKESNDFEKEFAEYLSKQGYWAYVCPKDKHGSQPADIIACGRHEDFLIDCKLSESLRFSFRRIEPNQRTAMDLFCKKTGRLECDCYFAIKYKEHVYRLGYDEFICLEEKGEKSVKIEDLWRVY